MSYTRNKYFDFIRGIAIIMVVGIHTFSPVHAEFCSLIGLINCMIRQLLNSAVPLFLAISGYFIASKVIDNKKSINIKKQIYKVYIPTLIFSLPYLFVASIGLNSAKELVANIFYFFICGYGVFYFIALIIQYYVLSGWLLKINYKKLLLISSMLSVISVSIVEYLLYALKCNISLIFYAGPFTLWIIFFCLGIFIRKCNRRYSLKLSVILAGVGLLLSIIECYLWLRFSGSPSYGIKLSSFIFSAGVIMAVFSPRMEKSFTYNSFNKAIIRIGEISFGIYLVHLMIVNVISMYVRIDCWLINWAIALMISVLVIELLDRIIPDQHHRLLGLP